MNADNTSLDSLSERVLDAVFEVSNTLGAGFLEKVYQRALLRELSLRGIQATAEASMAVVYKGHSVGEYFADLLVEDALVVEQNVPNALPASTPPSVSTICGLPAGPCAFSSISRSPKSSGSGSFLALPTGSRRRGITSRSIGLSSYLLDTTLGPALLLAESRWNRIHGYRHIPLLVTASQLSTVWVVHAKAPPSTLRSPPRKL